MRQLRKIVLIAPHESFEASAAARSMAAGADRTLKKAIATPGMAFDCRRFPIAHDLGRHDQGGYLVPACFEDQSAVDRFLDRRAPHEVRGIYSDPKIVLCPTICPDDAQAIGTAADVRQALNLQALKDAAATGSGVRAVIVDGGINEGFLGRSIAGRYPTAAGGNGETPRGKHGATVAFNTLLAAPDADIYDYPLMAVPTFGKGETSFLSNAMAAFDEIRASYEKDGQPTVVVNSWSLASRVTDDPPDAPGNYSDNREHPCNQAVARLVAAGVDVVFAAGNCGAACPGLACGPNDRGPDRSIHGANSLREVITVSAVSVLDDHLGFSSEGRGSIDPLKPDLAGFSHFDGSGLGVADTGTSTACPVVAGVVTAIRSSERGRDLTPAELKDYLTRNARRESLDAGWDT